MQTTERPLKLNTVYKVSHRELVVVKLLQLFLIWQATSLGHTLGHFSPWTLTMSSKPYRNNKSLKLNFVLWELYTSGPIARLLQVVTLCYILNNLQLASSSDLDYGLICNKINQHYVHMLLPTNPLPANNNMQVSFNSLTSADRNERKPYGKLNLHILTKFTCSQTTKVFANIGIVLTTRTQRYINSTCS